MWIANNMTKKYNNIRNKNKDLSNKGCAKRKGNVNMKKSGWRGFCKKLYKYRVFLLMLAPAVIYTLVFAYYPMTGIVMAFKKYNYAGGIWGSPWNGIENFKFF